MVSARLSVLLLTLLAIGEQLVSARPYDKRSASPDDVVVVIDTVYVNEKGERIDPGSFDSTVTTTVPAPKPTPSVKVESPSVKAPEDQTASTNDVSISAATKGGIVYSPYKADSTCKSEAEFLADTSKLKDFSFLRLYGIDCNQVKYGIAAGKKYGFKIFAGIYDIANSDAQIASLIKIVGSDWEYIHTVAVGNEVVNFGKMSANEVAGRVNSARTALRSAGYKGPVVTADTFVAIMANPVLCQASDYVAANCHPFFDGKVTAAQSGDFVKTQAQNVKNKCGGKEVLIAETGWPHKGITNGAAVPSLANQAAAISAIKNALGKNVIYFSAFDDAWKQDTPATYNTEKHWGIKNLAF